MLAKLSTTKTWYLERFYRMCCIIGNMWIAGTDIFLLNCTHAHPCYCISLKEVKLPTKSLSRARASERPISVVTRETTKYSHDFIHSLQPASRESSPSVCIGALTLESIVWELIQWPRQISICFALAHAHPWTIIWNPCPPWTIISHPCPPKTHGCGSWWAWAWAPNVGPWCEVALSVKAMWCYWSSETRDAH